VITPPADLDLDEQDSFASRPMRAAIRRRPTPSLVAATNFMATGDLMEAAYLMEESTFRQPSRARATR
jgi:hypothetical protein